jgi:hypothetical protein
LEKREKRFKWLRRLGFAGFMFFLAKGIVWLFVFYLLGKGCF